MARLPILSLVLFALAGCGQLRYRYDGNFTCPERGGPPWIRLVSEHFVMSSDVDPGEAAATLTEIEQTYGALIDLAFPFKDQPPETIQLVLFRRAQEYEEIAPKGSAGFYRRGGLGSGDQPLVVLYGTLTNEMRARLRHELVHRFVGYHYPQAPVWLNEGLADYYSTLELEHGKAVFGKAARHFTKGAWKDDRVPIGAVPRAAELLDSTPKTFYAGRAGGDEVQNMHHQHGFYAGAWVLVHLLKNGPLEYAQRFEAFLRQLAKGAKAPAAWQAAFGAVPQDKLQADMLGHMNRTQTMILSAPYQPRALSLAAAQPLSEPTLHLLWGQLRKWDPKGRVTAGRDLDESVAKGTTVEALLVRARWRETGGDRAGGERDVSAALALEPGHPDALLASFRHAIGQRDWAAAEATLLKLAPVATSVDALDAIARYHGMRHRPAVGLEVVKRALSRNQSFWHVWDTQAMLLFALGAAREAVESETLAIALFPHGEPPHHLLDRLAQFEAAAR